MIKNRLSTAEAYKLARFVEEHNETLINFKMSDQADFATKIMGIPITSSNVQHARIATNLPSKAGGTLKGEKQKRTVDTIARRLAELYESLGMPVPNDILSIFNR